MVFIFIMDMLSASLSYPLSLMGPRVSLSSRGAVLNWVSCGWAEVHASTLYMHRKDLRARLGCKCTISLVFRKLFYCLFHFSLLSFLNLFLP